MWKIGSVFGRYIGGRPAAMRRLIKLNFPIGRNVVIIGGQFAGCEIAMSLIKSGKTVTIIEESKRLGVDIGPVIRWVVMDMLRKGRVKMEAQVRVEQITKGSVTIAGERDKEEPLPADTVMLALGVKENRRLAQLLEGKAPAVYLVGDASAGEGISRIREAVKSGFDAGNSIR
jgi:2,4-dienoyl-CoA reductase (NADPH2)